MNNAVVLGDECVFDSDRLWSEAWSSVREANQPFREDGAMSWKYRKRRKAVFHQRAS
jgi:phosphoribosylaminoimidazole-succinocarboxamide synthase